jgi:hypothetical protein
MFEMFPPDGSAKDTEREPEQEPEDVSTEENTSEVEPEGAAKEEPDQAAKQESDQASDEEPTQAAEPASEAVAPSDLSEPEKEPYPVGPNYWGSDPEPAEPEPEQVAALEPDQELAEPAAESAAASDPSEPDREPYHPKVYQWEPEPGIAGQDSESAPEQATEPDPEQAVADYIAESESGPEQPTQAEAAPPEQAAEPEPEKPAEPELEQVAAEPATDAAAAADLPESEVESAPAEQTVETEPEREADRPEPYRPEPYHPEPEPAPLPTPSIGPPAALSEPAFDLLIAARPWLKHGRRAWIPLGPGDRPSVTVGERVTPITVAAEHVRDTRLLPVDPRDRAQGKFPPGSRIAPSDARPRRGRGALTEDGTVLYRSSRSRLNVVVGRLREPIYARADGTVVSVAPGGIELLLSGQALAGIAGAGAAVHGQLRIAVGDPGDELRPGGLHVADAGSIVVAGARVDVETLTRARALGIHGVIAGGMAGHDLRSFARSEERQRAALHSLPPFAVLVLEGFGRRSLAGPPWELLLAAAGTSVSIFPEPALLVFDPGATLPEMPSGTIRIAAGPGAGTAGTVDGPALIQRFEEGVHVLAVPFSGAGRRWIVPLGDLERFE